MSRITQFTNSLGVFNQTYDPVNLMPKLTTAPNGHTSQKKPGFLKISKLSASTM